MTDREPRLDPVLARAVAGREAPLDPGPHVDPQGLARIGRERARRALRLRLIVTWVSALAAAAVIALLVLMNQATAPL